MYINPSTFLRSGFLTKAVKGLMVACAAMFVLQVILPKDVELSFVSYLGLSVEGVLNGRFWQFISYAFLHGSFIHLLLNMLGLFFLGPELERTMGTRPFLLMFLFCSVLGGLGWFFLTYPYEGICVGASGGIFGLIGAFAGLFPHRQLTLLIFFVLPVTMPAWLLAVLFGLMQLVFLLNPGASGVAYSAHLAGGIAGFLFVKMVYRRGSKLYGNGTVIRSRRVKPSGPTQAEIDAILDKITREGIHSLTPRERASLQDAQRRR